MKLIPLTKGMSAIVDDCDYESVIKFKWRSHSGHKDNYYAIAGKSPTSILMHHLIIGVGLVDHKDGNGLNNQRTNLRPASKSQNAANCGVNSKNTSGFKGVTWSKEKRKWATRIRVNLKRWHLGYFKSLHDAAKAYDRAAIKFFGEFAKTNQSLGLLK